MLFAAPRDIKSGGKGGEEGARGACPGKKESKARTDEQKISKGVLVLLQKVRGSGRCSGPVELRGETPPKDDGRTSGDRTAPQQLKALGGAKEQFLGALRRHDRVEAVH